MRQEHEQSLFDMAQTVFLICGVAPAGILFFDGLLAFGAPQGAIQQAWPYFLQGAIVTAVWYVPAQGLNLSAQPMWVGTLTGLLAAGIYAGVNWIIGEMGYQLAVQTAWIGALMGSLLGLVSALYEYLLRRLDPLTRRDLLRHYGMLYALLPIAVLLLDHAMIGVVVTGLALIAQFVWVARGM